MKNPARSALLGLVCVLALQSARGGGGASAPSGPSGGGPTPTATPLYPAIMAVGDISCDTATPQLPCKSKETSDLVLAEPSERGDHASPPSHARASCWGRVARGCSFAAASASATRTGVIPAVEAKARSSPSLLPK